jgi:hypothetical protein
MCERAYVAGPAAGSVNVKRQSTMTQPGSSRCAASSSGVIKGDVMCAL